MTAPAAEDNVLWDVAEEHLDEAEFQAEAFERALDSAVYTLDALAKGPERWLIAHVDALVVNGSPTLERLLVPAVAEPDLAFPHKVMAAALALMQAGAWKRVAPLLFHEEPAIQRAIVRAASLAPSALFDRWVLAELGTANPESRPETKARLIGLLTYVAERRLTTPGPWFAWLQGGDPHVAAAAARAACWSDFQSHRPALEALLNRPEADVQNAARVPALMTGSGVAWADCERAALAAAPPVEAACLYAALGGPKEHTKLLSQLAVPSAKVATLLALGLSGNVQVVPALLRELESDEVVVRKLAVQAIAAITGLALDDDRFFLRPRPPATVTQLPTSDEESETSLPALEDEALDVPVLPLPEEALDDPDADAIDAWWTHQQRQLTSERRLLAGRPFTPSNLAAWLREGRTRLRGPLALSLLVRSGGRIRPHVRGFSDEQYRDTNVLAGLGADLLTGRTPGW